MSNRRGQSQTASSSIGTDRGRQVAEVCKKVFNHTPKRLAFTGGCGRNAFVVDMGDTSWMLVKRDSSDAAQLEARVLKALEGSKCTPKFKAVSDCWTVQEYFPGSRLPIVLHQTISQTQRVELVSKALEALVKIHWYGDRQQLIQHVPTIGADEGWFQNSTRAAVRFSNKLNIAPPLVDGKRLAKVLFRERDDFIKYDARPGNALFDGARCIWFDWEDCGRGNAVEDLAFVLCDEWMNLDEVAEKHLIDTYISSYKRKLSTGDAMRQLVLYGTLHMIDRVRLCLEFGMKDGGWWNRQDCLIGDKAGNTKLEMGRICSRVMRWADYFPETRGYVNWVNEIMSLFKLPIGNQTLLSARAA